METKKILLNFSVGVCVIQYDTGCVGRRGVHSISKGRGEISRPGIVFFTVVVKDLACHTTKNFLELDTRRNERPCPKFEIKKIEKFEKKKKIMSSKLLTDAE